MIDQRPYLQLLEESFPGIGANIAHFEALGFTWGSGQVFVEEEKGEVISHVGFLECPILIDGQWSKIGAVHGICTKSSHRGQGLASQLILRALEWAKSRCARVMLFTEIPAFYEKLSFRFIQEYRFHLPCRSPKGSQPLRPVIGPKDNELFLRCFREREPASNHVWIKDDGAIAAFNTLFATYPTFWSLHYSPVMDGFISYSLEGKTLHLFDVIAKKMPSLDLILDHLPTAIEEIYFYFSPERLTADAAPEPYLYDKGHLMIHGAWPDLKPFMIAPLSRC